MTLLVNEVFYSIQCEGSNVGMPAVFVRLSGCNMNCDFCDTDHSVKSKHSPEDLAHRVFMEFHNLGIKPVNSLCIITGGEPTIQDLSKFLPLLKEKLHMIVCMESNGILSPEWIQDVDFITVSPKTPITDIKLIDPDEVKVIWEKGGTPPENYYSFFNNHGCSRFYIQPEGNKKENIDSAIDYIKVNPHWSLSLQIQKMIGVR